MAKTGTNEHSSAIDSGNGKLELKNEHALIQVEGVLSTRGRNIGQGLLPELRRWCENEKRMNKEAKGGYSIAWRKLEALIKNDSTLRDLLLENCDDFREYVQDVASGDIVPTPTPPASVVVTRQQGGVRQGVAAIYGRTPTPKPPKADESGAVQSINVPPSERLKIGNGNE